MAERMPLNHNHVTRDIKPYGECPGCDHYWLAHAVLACDLCADPQFTYENVMIWELGKFEEPELINESVLWGICTSCAELVFHGEWDQIVARSEKQHTSRGQVSMIRTTMPALRRNAKGKVLRPGQPNDFGSTP